MSMSDARRYAIWPDPRSRSRSFWSSENCTFLRLSTSISSAVYNGSWQM